MAKLKHILTGRQFGWLTVLRRSGRDKQKVMWWCRCLCGAQKAISGGAMMRGSVKSCGCQGSRCNTAVFQKNYGMGLAIRIGEAVNRGDIDADQVDRRRIRAEAGPKWPGDSCKKRDEGKGETGRVRAVGA
jgi:hypothetical protein